MKFRTSGSGIVRRRIPWLGAFGAIAGVLVIANGMAVREAAERLNRTTTALHEAAVRLDRIESAVRKIQSTAVSPSVTTYKAARTIDPVDFATDTQVIASIHDRLDSIDDQLTDLWDAVASQPGSPETPSSELPPAAAPLPTRSIADVFQEEGGISSWGVLSADQLEAERLNNAFVRKFGGNLATDCRDTMCKIEWFIPDPELLAAEDRRELLNFADYALRELARSVPDVGRFATEYHLERDPPSVTLLIVKDSGEQ